MEEDIKKLQKLIDRCKECKFATCEQCEINWTEVYAIENLIARYKELEEGKALTKKQEAMILKAIKQSAEEQITKEMKNYIPKSKVQEKIEELKNRPNKMVIDKSIPEEYKNIFLDENAIKILQELIED